MANKQIERSGGKDRSLGPGTEPRFMSTLLVSSPGLLQVSLKITLAALPSVQVIGSASGCLSALCMVRDLRPKLLVIDSNLPTQDVQTLIKQIKQESLPSRTLVLTTTHDQTRQALITGADATLSRDASAEQFIELLDHLNSP